MAIPQDVYRQLSGLKSELDAEVRRMNSADLAQVLVNERQAYSHPWSEGIFRDCLSSAYENWVLVQAGVVVGHAVLSVSLEEAHLLNLCVSPGCQRRGFGRQFLDFIIDRAEDRGATGLYLEVRLSNQPAVQLYESTGFREIGRRKDYYPAVGGKEDALVMWLPLGALSFPE